MKALRLETVLFAAMLLDLAGSPTVEEFSEFVRATGSTNEIAPLFSEIVQGGGKQLVEWSLSVERSLSSPTNQQAVE